MLASLYALAVLAQVNVEPQVDPTSKVVGQNGCSIELIAIGDGQGLWWDRAGRSLDGFRVEYDLRQEELGRSAPQTLRDFVFEFDPGTASSTESSLLSRGWTSGVHVRGVNTASYRDVTSIANVRETDLWKFVVIRGAFATAGFKPFTRVVIELPTSSWVVEETIEVSPTDQDAPLPKQGEFSESGGRVRYKMSVGDSLPRDWKGDRFLTSPSSSRNSVGYVKMEPIDRRRLEDCYAFVGRYETEDGRMGWQVSTARGSMFGGHVDLSGLLPSDGRRSETFLAMAVEQVGAPMLILGGSANSPPVLVGRRRPVTFELRRRTFKTLSIKNIALMAPK